MTTDMKRNIDRAKFFEVSPEQLKSLLEGAVIDKNVRLIGMPKDAKFHTVSPTDFGRTWKVCVLSETFPSVEEGKWVPRMEIDPVYVGVDDGGWSLIHTYSKESCPGYVLVAWESGGYEGKRVDIGWFDNGEWHTAAGPLQEEGGPTHWRPMPEPPKEGHCRKPGSSEEKATDSGVQERVS